MTEIKTKKPFKSSFLSQFILAPSLLPLSELELRVLDSDLDTYEQLFLNPDIEKNLISKNELLASFAISKAENSQLTLEEAQEVYDLILTNQEYSFIKNKLKNKQRIGRKEYEKLEFFNIAKTFRAYNQNPIPLSKFTAKYIKDLHRQLTQGLDFFKDYLEGFDVYKSGQWRDKDTIRVGTYIPAPHDLINEGVEELLTWLQKNFNATSIGIFHTAFYALHPFCNGNKRVARVLEHIFLRDLGVNKKNLYSTSYYYHTEKDRYYKRLLASLEKRNLNHFVSFFQEALACSVISVVKTSIEVRRKEFIAQKNTHEQVKRILKPLIKQREVQFKNLFKAVRGKMVRQTFVTYLHQAVEEKLVLRREAGRAVFYRLNTLPEEEHILANLLDFTKTKLAFIPDEIKFA